jgi:histidyl-tRNA synthetase
MNQKRYIYRVKVLTLRILEQNDFIFLKTEKETGISRQTIKVWSEMYGADVFTNKSPIEVALELIDEELIQTELKALDSISTSKLQILEQISKLIDSEKSIVRLARVLSYLHKMGNELESSGRYNLRHPNYNNT